MSKELEELWTEYTGRANTCSLYSAQPELILGFGAFCRQKERRRIAEEIMDKLKDYQHKRVRYHLKRLAKHILLNKPLSTIDSDKAVVVQQRKRRSDDGKH